MAKFIVFFIVLLAATLSMVTMACNPGCHDIVSNIKPCQAYIAAQSSEVLDECCSGIMKLNAIAQEERGGRRRICNCMNECNNISDGVYENGPVLCEAFEKDLFFRCNIQQSFSLPESMDCSQVID